MAQPDFPPGVHVFERGWLSANNILFTGGGETVLVDSGYCTHAPQTLALVESVLGPRPLDVLINTHLHSDHCGGNAALQARYPDLRTLIPPGHAQQVADWDPVALTYLPTGQLCPQFGFTWALQPGTSMLFGTELWEVHAAPGHDPHSLIFFEPRSRVLISADALWENGFGVVFPELEGADAFSQVAATLDLIERLNPKTVVPGHGRVFAYAPQVLVRARQRLDSFIDNPSRHAHHAAKVLLKFKLLETQRQDFEAFAQWALETPYFTQIKAKFFADISAREWIGQLSAELVAAGVAQRDGSSISNA
ncbi:MBL fold metallo-hydrolase [Polaromonas sp. JS666]|uniref:MBL fold metallo-hydrolase n=1 Tax=Polaromonas sp. (strain JS666 / ATCC BAA-500) TaxID=296591 RepID=UPI00088599C4|nr:MBL fold metallo-hydrolase [Polaromonas sp. JS666]SDO00272.1 Glyoxylase, beta-lactamase superfamily II [Polaromonas sp. JS666]